MELSYSSNYRLKPTRNIPTYNLTTLSICPIITPEGRRESQRATLLTVLLWSAPAECIFDHLLKKPMKTAISFALSPIQQGEHLSQPRRGKFGWFGSKKSDNIGVAGYFGFKNGNTSSPTPINLLCKYKRGIRKKATLLILSTMPGAAGRPVLVNLQCTTWKNWRKKGL